MDSSSALRLILPVRFWTALLVPDVVNLVIDFRRVPVVHCRLPTGGLRTVSLGDPKVTDAELRAIHEHAALAGPWSLDNNNFVRGSGVRVSRILRHGEIAGFTIHVSEDGYVGAAVA